jgi:hypothetical protein
MKLIKRQYYFASSRFFSSTSINLGTELQKPKPFKAIPKLTTFNAIAGFMPGGQFYGKELQELHSILQNKYGKIVKFPAIFGRPPFVFAYQAEDFEKVILTR